MSFHGKAKKYVKDAIEKFCSVSNVKPSLEGEKEDLERYYRSGLGLCQGLVWVMSELGLGLGLVLSFVACLL
jgi:hypothetical protein